MNPPVSRVSILKKSFRLTDRYLETSLRELMEKRRLSL